MRDDGAMTGTDRARTALVTGAGQGLGAAIARALGEAGHDVVVADLDSDAARASAESLRAEPSVRGRIEYRTIDVRDEASIEAVVSEFDIDILVNNAAITESVPFLELDRQRWQRLMDVNLTGCLLVSQAIVPGMASRGWGRIINMTSQAGQRGGPAVQGIHYAASKAGIIGMTRYLAHDLADRGITVNAIAPGAILTPQTALAPADKLAAVACGIPVGRLGTPEEIGAAAVYLAGEQSGFVTGAVLDVNGGSLMR